MEYINKHIGIFDFWSVFGGGVVILTSAVVVLYIGQVNKSILNEFPLYLYIALAYVIGFILHNISSILSDLKVLKLDTRQVFNSEGKGIFKEYYKNTCKITQIY